MTLDDFFIEKARNELRETEEKKAESLKEFRDWIENHPFLMNVRQDDVHLLIFLRGKKYNMADATDAFEKYYLALHRFAKFIPTELSSYEKSLEMFKTGYCYPLPGRDSEGCRVLFVQTRRLDTKFYDLFDGIKLSVVVLRALIEDEENQIAGIKVLLDQKDFPMKQMLSLSDAAEFMKMIKTVTPTRQKGVTILNLPFIAHYLMRLFLKFLTEKVRSRTFVFQNWNELRNSSQFDISMLPKELGGIKPEAEIIQEYYEEIKQKWEILTQSLELNKVDFSKVPSDKKRFLKKEKNGCGLKQLDE